MIVRERIGIKGHVVILAVEKKSLYFYKENPKYFL